MESYFQENQAQRSELYFERQESAAQRRRLEEKLAFLEDYNRHLVESTGACIMLVNQAGQVLSLNRRARELLEIADSDNCLHASWASLFPGLDSLALPKTLDAQINSSFLASSRTRSGETKYWSFALSAVAGTSSEPARFLIVAQDITEHVQVEKALRDSEEAFRKIFEENPIGILIADLDFHVLKVNSALCGMLGFTEKDLLSQEIRGLTLCYAQDVSRGNLARLLRGNIRSFECETMLETRRKEKIWIQLTTSILRDAEGHPSCILQMIENIHARKESEARVLAYQERLQSLASELSLSEERERRRIATNLHDRIGQSLAFARLKLGSLGEGKPNGCIEEVRELIEQTIVDARSLTFELSPPVLYELGLVPAVEWLARKIHQEHGIPTRFHDDGQPKPLDEDFRVVLFQAVRELLVNVVKHARASHAQVWLRRDADALRIIIEDDGTGFDISKLTAQRDSSRSFGLFNIRERVEYLGGRLYLRSEPGHGTRVTLIAPLKLGTLGNGNLS